MSGSAIRRESVVAIDARARREKRRMLEERLATDPAWRRDSREMAALLRDPALGVELAGALVSELPWRVVAQAARDARVSAGVRQTLDRGLARRASGLSRGEQIALARLAEPETRKALAALGEETVLEALAGNPRLGARERAQRRAELVGLRVRARPLRESRETFS